MPNQRAPARIRTPSAAISSRRPEGRLAVAGSPIVAPRVRPAPFPERAARRLDWLRPCPLPPCRSSQRAWHPPLCPSRPPRFWACLKHQCGNFGRTRRLRDSLRGYQEPHCPGGLAEPARYRHRRPCARPCRRSADPHGCRSFAKNVTPLGSATVSAKLHVAKKGVAEGIGEGRMKTPRFCGVLAGALAPLGGLLVATPAAADLILKFDDDTTSAAFITFTGAAPGDFDATLAGTGAQLQQGVSYSLSNSRRWRGCYKIQIRSGFRFPRRGIDRPQRQQRLCAQFS